MKQGGFGDTGNLQETNEFTLIFLTFLSSFSLTCQLDLVHLFSGP